MSEVFGDETCIRWWLPNDEGFSPVLKNVRTFADERNATAASAHSETLRDVRHVFAKMEIQGSGSSKNDPSGKGKDI
jgi:hypothetical protein